MSEKTAVIVCVGRDAYCPRIRYSSVEGLRSQMLAYAERHEVRKVIAFSGRLGGAVIVAEVVRG